MVIQTANTTKNKNDNDMEDDEENGNDKLEQRVAQFFRERLKQDRGLPPSRQDILDHFGVESGSRGEEIVSRFLTGKYPSFGRPPFLRQPVYQTAFPPRLGMYHMDHADFHREWSEQNRGATGFILAVECFTGKLWLAPVRNKSSNTWLSALGQFVGFARNVKTIFSDRDPVFNDSFRKLVKDRLGVNWRIMAKGSKAYMAERYIGIVKEKLGQALLRNSPTTNKNWIRFVEPLQRRYNSLPIPGTDFRRDSVNEANFIRFMLAKSKSPDLSSDSMEMIFPSTRISHLRMADKFFKFSIGDKVVLSKRANWKKEPGSKERDFKRYAREKGGWESKILTISDRQLRLTARPGLSTYVPMYALAEQPPHTSLFYESELKKIWTTTDDDHQESDSKLKIKINL